MPIDTLRTVLMFGGLGVVTGVLSGFFGIGGGVILVPALVFVLGLSQHGAQGTSLAVFTLPVGLLGALRYFKEGQVNIAGALILALGLFIGAYFGADRAAGLPDVVLRRSFAVFLVIIAVRMFFTKS